MAKSRSRKKAASRTTARSKTAAPKKQHFQFNSLRSRSRRGLAPDDAGSDVWQLQAFLTQYGYLGRLRDPGRMCHFTCDAVRHFQKCYGLNDTGKADPKTLNMVQRPRCGVPDIGQDVMMSSGPAAFTLVGCNYNTNDLSYAFLNGTNDLPGGREREIVREAFGVWADVTPLRFNEVAPGDSPTFTISWDRGDHGDGFPFDDGGSIGSNTLAHAFFPPPCGGTNAGAMHFDDFERWTDAAAAGSIRLLNVAIHEIGHLLGLRHSNVQGAIMFAFYDDNVDSLRQDDIDGIQALYGARPITGPAPLRGRLTRSGDSDLHRVQAQSGRMTVTLIGPAGQDFDLYVRAGLPPDRQIFDARGFSASASEQVELNVSGGEVFILVDAWRGSGSYEVEVSFS